MSLLNNLRFRNNRSVAFQMMSFAVPTRRARPLRNRIYARINANFNATPTRLTSGTQLDTRIFWDIDTRFVELNQRRFRAEVLSPAPVFNVDFTAPFTNDFNTIDGQSGSFRVDEKLGRILDLLQFGNQLLIVQQFGLSTLDVSFDPNNFRLTTLVHSNSEIVQHTCNVLGDTIYFLTHGGMCRVRNGRLELLNIEYEYSGFSQYISTIHNNTYFLSTGGVIIGIENFHDSYFFWAGHNTMFWESDDFSLGYAATRQFLKQIRLRTSGDITIRVITENREQLLQVRGGAGIQRINVNIKGEAFRLRIDAPTAGITITDLTAVIGFAPAN